VRDCSPVATPYRHEELTSPLIAGRFSTNCAIRQIALVLALQEDHMVGPPGIDVEFHKRPNAAQAEAELAYEAGQVQWMRLQQPRK
jgi:hypothetical protein